MSPNEVKQLRAEVFRTIPSFADWLADRIETNSLFNGTSVAAEREAMFDQWDQVLAGVEFRSARIAVRLLEVGRRRCPYYGELLRYLRQEASNIAAARRKTDEARAQKRAKERERGAELAAAAAEGPSLVEQLRTAVRAKGRELGGRFAGGEPRQGSEVRGQPHESGGIAATAGQIEEPAW